jgi:hypothetical protein
MQRAITVTAVVVLALVGVAIKVMVAPSKPLPARTIQAAQSRAPFRSTISMSRIPE